MASTKGSVVKVRRALCALAFVLRLLEQGGSTPPENTGGAAQAQPPRGASCRCGREHKRRPALRARAR